MEKVLYIITYIKGGKVYVRPIRLGRFRLRIMYTYGGFFEYGKFEKGTSVPRGIRF